MKNFQTPKDDFTIRESTVTGRLGLGRDRVAELRQNYLTEGADWRRLGRDVCWSEQGLQIVLEALKLEKRDLPAEKNGGQTGNVLAQEWAFKVYRVDIPHPYLILATDGENIFRVRVKTKANFVKGMEVRCRHEQADLFSLVGNCPRFRGKY